MQDHQTNTEEKVWWVRYIYKSDLACGPNGRPHQENAFFHAHDEDELQKQIAGWMRYIKHNTAIVQKIEQVTPDFRLEFSIGPLPQLPAEQAEAVLVAYSLGTDASPN